MTPEFQYAFSDIHRRYDEGRRPSPGALAALAEAVRRHAPSSVQRVLDLGCGTGRFSRLLLETFGCPVVAIEPAGNMLGVAITKQLHPAIKFVRGSALSIPIADAAFDLVFISQVLHHLPDLAVAMAEMRRVLKNGGRIFVRQSTRENLDSYVYQRFFPSARALDERRLPPREQIRAIAIAAGLVPTCETEAARRVEFASAREYIAKIATRTNSDLAMVPDDEFASGMEQFSRYVDAHPGQAWIEEVDHLVFTAAVGGAS